VFPPRKGREKRKNAAQMWGKVPLVEKRGGKKRTNSKKAVKKGITVRRTRESNVGWQKQRCEGGNMGTEGRPAPSAERGGRLEKFKSMVKLRKLDRWWTSIKKNPRHRIIHSSTVKQSWSSSGRNGLRMSRGRKAGGEPVESSRSASMGEGGT